VVSLKIKILKINSRRLRMELAYAQGFFLGGSMKGDVRVHFFVDSRGDLFASANFFVGEGKSGKSDAAIIFETRCDFDEDIIKRLLGGDESVFLKAAELILKKIVASDPGSKFGELALMNFASVSSLIEGVNL
jgi:hypothetical protein